MSLKRRIPTAQLHRTTQQDTWAPSFWALRPERSWPTGAVIGGRHTVTRVTITHTRRRTVALITATVIITARLITTTTRELMDGKGVRLARTDLQPGGLVIILTRERTHEAAQYRQLTGAEVPRRHTIHTQAPMHRPGKVPVPQLNGAAPMCREEIRALPWGTTRARMEQ